MNKQKINFLEVFGKKFIEQSIPYPQYPTTESNPTKGQYITIIYSTILNLHQIIVYKFA